MSAYAGPGRAIRAERLSRNFTQAHLAALAGVSEKTIRRVEAGERIAADSVRSLCAALNLNAEELHGSGTPGEVTAETPVAAPDVSAVRLHGAMMALSCIATMAALAFQVPVEVVVLGFALASCATVAFLLGLVALFLARPHLRERFVDQPRIRAISYRTEALSDPGLFCLLTLGSPPVVGIAILTLREVVREPSLVGAFELVVLTVIAATLSTFTVAVLTTDGGRPVPKA